MSRHPIVMDEGETRGGGFVGEPVARDGVGRRCRNAARVTARSQDQEEQAGQQNALRLSHVATSR
jgi:hypothetical protein